LGLGIDRRNIGQRWPPSEPWQRLQPCSCRGMQSGAADKCGQTLSLHQQCKASFMKRSCVWC
jgi:hypothetical protein